MSKVNLHNYEAFLIDYFDGNLKGSALAELKAFVLSNPHLEIDLNDLDLPAFSEETINVDFKNELKKEETFIEDEEIISYLENKLTEVEVKEFEYKLLNNNELEFKYKAYKKTILSNDPSLVFEDKARLNKTENEFSLNNVTLAYIEKQLGSSDKLKFEKELKTNSALQNEVSLFSKTKFIADTSIVFPNKADLKKETKVIALFSFRTVVSVAAAILLIIGLTFVFNYYNSKPVITNELAKNDFNKTLKSTEDQSVKTVDSIKSLVPLEFKSSDLKAGNIGNTQKHKNSKNESVIKLNEVVTNSVASNETETKTAITNTVSVVDTSSTKMATANLPESHYLKQNFLITEELEMDEPVTSVPAKKGFWQRAVSFAKQANKFGLKSIDGEETPNKNYALSFNAFSVEKR